MLWTDWGLRLRKRNRTEKTALQANAVFLMLRNYKSNQEGSSHCQTHGILLSLAFSTRSFSSDRRPVWSIIFFLSSHFIKSVQLIKDDMSGNESGKFKYLFQLRHLYSRRRDKYIELHKLE